MDNRQEITLFLERVSRKLIAAKTIDSAAIAAIVGASIAVTVLILGLFFAMSIVSLWWLITPVLFTIITASIRIIKSGNIIQAGVLLDSKFACHEIFSMAGELASIGCETKPALLIYQVAVEKSNQIPEKTNYCHRGPKTIAVLLLLILLCFVLHLPARGFGGEVVSFEKMDQIRNMKTNEKNAIIEQIQENPAVSGEYKKIAIKKVIDLANDSSEEDVLSIIELLKRSGIKLEPEISETSGGSTDQVALPKDSLKPESVSKRHQNKQPSIAVYNKDYTNFINKAKTGGNTQKEPPSVIDNGNSWDEAKAEANNTIRSTDFPLKYRVILKAFFSTNE